MHDLLRQTAASFGNHAMLFGEVFGREDLVSGPFLN